MNPPVRTESIYRVDGRVGVESDRAAVVVGVKKQSVGRVEDLTRHQLHPLPARVNKSLFSL